MLVEIISDTICPWCYLGKRRFEAALERRPGLEVEVRWLPFELNPAMPEAGVPREDYLAAKLGGREALRQGQERLVELGAALGVDYRFDRILLSPNTRAAHALSRAAAELGRQDEVQEALFRAYFTEGEDIGDVDTLVRIGAAHGLDPDATRERLRARHDWAPIAASLAEIQQAGISAVPFFVFERRVGVAGAQEVATFEQVLDDLAGTPAAPP